MFRPAQILPILIGILGGLLVVMVLPTILGENITYIIVIGFFALFMIGSVIGSYLYVWLQGRRIITQSHMRGLPFPDVLPENFQPHANSLQSLGFKPFGVMEIAIPTEPEPQYVYAFANKAHNVIAYLGVFGEEHVRFSCYYVDGYDVSTDYPHGYGTQTPKTINRTVETSIEAALDYHIYHGGQHMAEHGKPRTFDSVQGIAEWETEQNYIQDSVNVQIGAVGKQYLKLMFATLIIPPFVTSTIALALIIFFKLTEFSAPSLSGILMIVGVLTLVMSVLWAYRTPQPQTVEQRKKQKQA